MNKTLFEKLTKPGKPVNLRQSVTDNIERILASSGYLDADAGGMLDPGKALLESIYPGGLPYVVDKSSGNDEQLKDYRKMLRKALLKFEPRLKDVTVSSIQTCGFRSACRLKIELYDGEFEQEFVFAQS